MSTQPVPSFALTPPPAKVVEFNRFALIPSELKDEKNFVCWRYETRDGKPTKVPYNARTGSPAKCNDRSTWCSFAEAIRAASSYNGIGFQLEDPYVGFDFDGVRHDGNVENYVHEVLALLGNPYAEITPSGKGIRTIVKGALPEGRRKIGGERDGEKYGVEVYGEGRYLTLTGNHYSGSGVPLADVRIPYQICLNEKFRALWLGDVSAYGGDESSADLALCGLLARIIVQHPEGAISPASIIEEWFSKSRLGQRDKWLRREDYRRRTIDKALSGTEVPEAQKPQPARAKTLIASEVPKLGPPTADGINSRLTLTPAQHIEMKALKWLWPDKIPLGKSTLFCGDPDIGKSLAVADVVATVTRGRDWPDAPNEYAPAHVAMMCGEDEWEDTVVPRLVAANADLTKVHRVSIQSTWSLRARGFNVPSP